MPKAQSNAGTSNTRIFRFMSNDVLFAGTASGFAILTLVAMLIAYGVKQARLRDRVETYMKLEYILLSLKEYYSQSNRVPDTLEGLLGNAEAKARLSLHDSGADPFSDAWGHRLIYESSATNVLILSQGRDGLRGSSDDIVVTHPWPRQVMDGVR